MSDEIAMVGLWLSVVLAVGAITAYEFHTADLDYKLGMAKIGACAEDLDSPFCPGIAPTK